MNALPHLTIADHAWRYLGWPQAVRGHMLLGAVAPDAYHLVAGLGYRTLHFRSRTVSGQRLMDFLEEHLRPALAVAPSPEAAFWTGWLSHILADGLWRRAIRAELPALWSSCLAGRGPDVSHLRDEYRRACDAVDRQLADLRPNYVAELRWLLRGTGVRYNVRLISPGAVSHWAGRLTVGALPPPPSPPSPDPHPIGYPFVLRAMDAAEEEVMALMHSELRQLGMASASATGSSSSGS